MRDPSAPLSLSLILPFAALCCAASLGAGCDENGAPSSNDMGVPDAAVVDQGGGADCAGVAGGSATVDDCGICDDDASNDNTSCVQDCEGTWGGPAATDHCGVCDADQSNDDATCTQDCAGTWGGSATTDQCGVCDDNPANDNTTCAQDCAGTWGGSATTDQCGVCDDNPANDNTTCPNDCNGVPNGPATRDDCGVCDDNAANDNMTCVQDCAGTWGGSATTDSCGVCDDDPNNDDACIVTIVVPADYDTYISPGHSVGHDADPGISFGACQICPTYSGSCAAAFEVHERAALLNFTHAHQRIPSGAVIGAVELVFNVELAMEIYDVDDEFIRVVQTGANGWPSNVLWSTPGIHATFGAFRDVIGPQPATTGELVVDVESTFVHYLNNVDSQARPHFTIAVSSEQCYFAVTSTEGAGASRPAPHLRITYRTN